MNLKRFCGCFLLGPSGILLAEPMGLRFVNRAAGNYELAAGSPSYVDVGAFERQEPSPAAPAREAWLVGEHPDHRGAEMLLEGLVVGLVGEAEEGPHGVGTEQVGGGRGPALAPLLAGMHAADVPAGGDHREGHQAPRPLSKPDGVAGGIHDSGPIEVQFPALAGPPGDHRRHVLPSARRFRPDFGGAGHVPGRDHQSLRGEGRVRADHLAVGRARRVHPLVVQAHPHPRARGLFHGKPHVSEPTLAHVRDSLGQPHPGVDHEAVDAAAAKLLHLPGELAVVQLVVPEPERHLGELAARLGQLPPPILCRLRPAGRRTPGRHEHEERCWYGSRSSVDHVGRLQ